MEKDDREKYLLLSGLPSYKKKVRLAKEVMEEAIEKSTMPSVSFSFGKDSLVCVDIARKIKPDILIINIDRGRGGDLQEVEEMYDGIAKEEGWNYHRVKTPREIFEIYRDAGGIENIKKGAVNKNLMAGVKTANETFGIDCSIMGLRLEESRGRSYLKKYGCLHYSWREDIYKCKPVLYWKGEEIWAYIISHGLAYPRWYDLEARHVGYERARYSNWAGLVHISYGRTARLKMNHPEEWQLFSNLFPEIRHYY